MPEKFVSIPRALLSDVLDTAMADSEAAQTGMSTSAEQDRAHNEDREKINKLWALIEPAKR